MDDDQKDSALEMVADNIADKVSSKVVSLSEGRTRARSKGKSSKPETESDPGQNPPKFTAGPYCIASNGRLYYTGGDYPKLLANFDARIVTEILIDDGAEQRRELEISGTLSTGKPLPNIEIPASQFSGLGWVLAKWGPIAVLNAGQTVKDRTRCAIQNLSANETKQRFVFEHTGWRKIDGRWLYLFNGGAISKDGIETSHEVRLPGTLKDYALHLPDDPATAIRASLRMLDVAPPEIAIPSFLAPWRALLSEAMPVDFSLFLQGTTGARKSEIAAIIQAHWGKNWNGKHLPAAWSSTANSLERSAFLTKDAVLVVDDFNPNGSSTDISRAHQNADRLLRAQGNRAGRGRMNADGSQRPEYFPRGLIVATGEDMPRGQSARGRTLALEFGGINTVSFPILSELQTAASTGLLAGATGAFCRWLAANLDALKARLPDRRVELRNAMIAQNAGHSRHPDTLASLQVTAEVFAEFANIHGVTLDAAWQERIIEGLRATNETQAQFQATEEPAARFVRLIHAALASGRCHVKPLDGEKPPLSEDMTSKGWVQRTYGNEYNARTEWHECGPCVGRFEGTHLYLDPEAAYATAQEFAAHQGQPIPVSQRTLAKALDQKGYLCTKDPNGKHLTIRVRLPDGTRPRFLHMGGGYEISGPSGPSGPSNKQPTDSKVEKSEKSGTTNHIPQNSSGPSGPSNDQPPMDSGTTKSDWDHYENSESAKWSQQNGCNTLSCKDKNDGGTTGTTGTTNTHTPPLGNGDVPIPSGSGSLETRIISTLKSSPSGLKQEDLTRLVSNSKGASNAMIETVLVRLMKGGEIGKINDRLVANP